MNQAAHTVGADDDELVRMAELLKVLGHPIRLQIVLNLIESSSCVKDIWGCLGLPQASVSQHLSALRAHGIVRGNREGTTVTYEVVDPVVRNLIRHLRKEKVI